MTYQYLELSLSELIDVLKNLPGFVDLKESKEKYEDITYTVIKVRYESYVNLIKSDEIIPSPYMDDIEIEYHYDDITLDEYYDLEYEPEENGWMDDTWFGVYSKSINGISWEIFYNHHGFGVAKNGKIILSNPDRDYFFSTTTSSLAWEIDNGFIE